MPFRHFLPRASSKSTMRLKMMSAMAVLAWVGCSATTSTNFNHLDVNNRICKNCVHIPKSKPTTWSYDMDRTCILEESCALYEDFFLGSPYYETPNDAPFPSQQCPTTTGIYMRSIRGRAECYEAQAAYETSFMAFPNDSSSTFYYSTVPIIYRNNFCATCHRGQNLEVEVVCNDKPYEYKTKVTKTRDGNIDSLSYNETGGIVEGDSGFKMLFDLNKEPRWLTQLCGDHQLYDPFFKQCRNTSIPARTLHLSPTVNTTIANYTVPILNCMKFILEKTDYTIEGKTVYIDKYQKRFRKGEFNITKNGRLEICSDTIGIKLVNSFDSNMVYITLSGIGVSILFLIIHLFAFCLVPELRNLPGKNMASLCVALLMAYISFTAGMFLQGDACIVVSVLAFYCFLASFAWMLTMSFDVWRTLRMSSSQLRVSSGKQWHKFILYSICSWLFPALLVMLALLAEFFIEVGSEWRPNFASNANCWFGHIKPLLIFFFVPLAIVMLLNIGFFASSARIVYSTRISHPVATTYNQLDFRMYLRLAVMMGLTWTLGLIAGILDFDALWYIFTLLNTLHGLFIFLAFTCKDKVISLANRKNNKIRRYL